MISFQSTRNFCGFATQTYLYPDSLWKIKLSKKIFKCLLLLRQTFFLTSFPAVIFHYVLKRKNIDSIHSRWSRSSFLALLHSAFLPASVNLQINPVSAESCQLPCCPRWQVLRTSACCSWSAAGAPSRSSSRGPPGKVLGAAFPPPCVVQLWRHENKTRT